MWRNRIQIWPSMLLFFKMSHVTLVLNRRKWPSLRLLFIAAYTIPGLGFPKLRSCLCNAYTCDKYVYFDFSDRIQYRQGYLNDSLGGHCACYLAYIIIESRLDLDIGGRLMIRRTHSFNSSFYNVPLNILRSLPNNLTKDF